MGTAQNDVFSQLKLNVFVLCKICDYDRLCIMFSTATLIRGGGIKPGAHVKRLPWFCWERLPGIVLKAGSWPPRWRFRFNSATNPLTWVTLSTLWTHKHGRTNRVLTEEWQWPGLRFEDALTSSSQWSDRAAWQVMLRAVFRSECHLLPCEVCFDCAQSKRHEANGSSCAQLPAKLQLQMVYTQQTSFFTLFKTDTLHLMYICGVVFSWLDFLSFSFFFFYSFKYHNRPCTLATIVWPQCFSVNWEGKY